MTLNVMQRKVLCSAEKSSVIWVELHSRSSAEQFGGTERSVYHYWEFQLSISCGTQNSAKMPQTRSKMIWSFFSLEDQKQPLSEFYKILSSNFQKFIQIFLNFFAHILYENNSVRVHKNSTKFYEKKFKIKSTNLCFSMYPDLRCS